MALSKEKKQNIIEELKEKIAKQKAIVFFDLTGLKVKDLSDLRKKMKADNNEIKVAKKTLMGIVLKEEKLPVDPKEMPGEVALAIGYQDEISPAKTLWQFSQQNPDSPLKILGGIFEKDFISGDRVIELGQLPSKQELLGRLAGSLASPISGFMNVLQGNLRNLVYILSAIKK